MKMCEWERGVEAATGRGVARFLVNCLCYLNLRRLNQAEKVGNQH
jgi:hypothetical protein